LLKFDRDIRQVIRERTSIRSYRSEAIPSESRTHLEEACARLKLGPLGTPCRFVLLDRRADSQAVQPSRDGGTETHLGTYGVVRGASTYLAGAATNAPFAFPDFGYLFELLVLKATDLGLGTCWLGGTYRRSDFARALGLDVEEILPAVSPVGLAAGRRGLVDRLIRLGASSKHRRPWEELFFDARGRPLEVTRQPEGIGEALEAVRLAPSASNRQPWRLVRDGEAVHFYLERTPGYAAFGHVDLQRMDVGIAMSHFELGLRAAEPGAGDGSGWSALDARRADSKEPQLPSGFHNYEYVVSWLAKG
jgi:nitroreductase